MQLKRIDSLQIFRGLAALSVVICHASISTNALVGKIPSGMSSIFDLGFLGVDFFFVLSGFIIMSSHFDDEKSIAALKIYGIKRFVRLFPPYWPVSIALLLCYFLLPSLSHEAPRDISLLSSLLLLPDTGVPALVVAWTLIHEVAFYIFFCLFFISNRLFLIFLAVWVSAICATVWGGGGANFSPLAWIDGGTGLPSFPALLLCPINLEFVLGMGVAYLARGVSNRFALPLIFLGGFIFVLLLWWPFALECRILFGLPFAALTLGAVLLERQGKLVLPRSMVLMGDASYSIYLTHTPLLSVTSRLVGRMHGFASWGLGMLVGVVFSVMIGVLYHLYIEKPIMNLFRQRLDRLRVA